MNFTSKLFNKKLHAFSLMEVLLALVIIGILASMAVAVFSPAVSKAKATEAKLQLEHLYTMQKTYFFENSKYGTEIIDIGFEQAKLVSEGGNANYKIEIINASNTGFVARATAITDFDADGAFNVWEINQDQKLIEVTPD